MKRLLPYIGAAFVAQLVVSSLAWAAVRYVKATGDFMTGRLLVDVASTGSNAVQVGAGDFISFGTSGSFPGSGMRGGTSFGSTGIQTGGYLEELGIRSAGLATASIPAASANSAGLLMRSTTDDAPYWNTAAATKKLAYFTDIPATPNVQQFLDGYLAINTDNTVFTAGAFLGASCSKLLMTCTVAVQGTGGGNVTIEAYDVTTATSKGTYTFACAAVAGTVSTSDVGPQTYATQDIIGIRANGCTVKPFMNCHITCNP